MRTKKLATVALCVMLVATIVLPAGIANGAGIATWAPRVVPGLDGEIRSVQFLSAVDGYLLEHDAGANRLWVTENAGDTWTDYSIWPSGTFIMLGDSVEIMDVEFRDDGLYGWAVGVFKDRSGTFPAYTWEYDPVIYATTNGGKTWTNQTGNFDTDLSGLGALTAVHSAGGSDVYVCGDTSMMLATHSHGDSAGDWKVLSSGNVNFMYNDVTSGYAGPGTVRVLAVGENSVVVQYDYTIAADFWDPALAITVSAGGLDFNSIVCPDTSEDGLLAVGADGLFAWSNDDGTSWTVGNTGGDVDWKGVQASSSAAALAAGSSGNVGYFTASGSGNVWSYADLGPTGVTTPLQDVVSRTGNIWGGGTDGMLLERDWSAARRTSGDDRYKTAVALSSTWPDDSVDSVVIATGMDFPDALSASGLAGALECPLLLVGSSLSAEVANEISRLGPDDIFIIGGLGAVSATVEDQLEQLSIPITRIAGSNRYHTSQLVATRIANIEGSNFGKIAFIARGDSFADALACSPFAYSQKIPVLLTASTSLSGNTLSALGSLDIEDAIVVGGTSAVSDPVKAAVQVVTLANGGSTAVRWSGSDRYATAATVARGGMLSGWATSAFVGLATGADFPDALGGGPVCGAAGGVMLLTSGTSLSSAAGKFLDDYAGDILEVNVFGGTSVVSEAVRLAAGSRMD